MAQIDVIQSQPLELWRYCVALVDGRDTTQTMQESSGLRVFDHMEDRFRLYPTSTGTTTLTAASHGTTDSTTLNVVADSHSPARNAVCYGNSITAAATSNAGWVKELKDDLGSDLTLLGTQGTTYPHEGHSGKDWEWFATNAASPLTSATDTLDIGAHVTALGATPYFAIWQSGENECFTASTGAESGWQALINAQLDHMDDVLDAYTAEVSGVTHIVMMALPGAKLDAVWTAYGSPGARWAYRKMIHLYNETLLTRIAARSDAAICAAGLAVDPVSGYSASDAIHPQVGAEHGHLSMARMVRYTAVANW